MRNGVLCVQHKAVNMIKPLNTNASGYQKNRFMHPAADHITESCRGYSWLTAAFLDNPVYAPNSRSYY